MTNPHRAQVNQRLYFITLHLEWLQGMLKRETVSAAVIEQAVGESLTLHLVLAYRAYLRELAAAYQLPAATPQTAVELDQLLRTQQRASAECQEWVALEQSDSWLARLLRVFNRIGNDDVPATGGRGTGEQRAETTQIKAMQIQAIQVQDHQHLSAKQLESTCQFLQQMISRQRNHLEEW